MSPGISFTRSTSAMRRSCAQSFSSSRPTRSCIWPRRRTSTGRSTAPAISFRRTSSARISFSKSRASIRRSKRDSFRLLHVSTDEVYGSLGPTGLFTEDSPYSPNSPYSASKAGSDHLARAWFETYRLPVLVTNCSNNYGPYQFPEKLIPLTILKALQNQSIPVYGDGMQVRDWLHVEDHVRGLVKVLESGVAGRTYNIGGTSERTNLTVVQTILRSVARRVGPRRGRDARLDRIRHRPSRSRSTLCDRCIAHAQRTRLDRADGFFARASTRPWRGTWRTCPGAGDAATSTPVIV